MVSLPSLESLHIQMPKWPKKFALYPVADKAILKDLFYFLLLRIDFLKHSAELVIV